MTISNTTKRTMLERSLLAGIVLFALAFTFRLYVVPLHTALDGPLPAALTAAAMAAAAWWFAFRRWGGEPDAGRSPERGDMARTVRISLLNAAVVLVLFPFFKFCVLSAFPQVDGLLAAALAGGAAGGLAPWLVRLARRS